MLTFAYWDCGFEYRRWHGCVSFECCVLSGRGLRESECDREASTMMRPRPFMGCRTLKKKEIHQSVHHVFHPISFQFFICKSSCYSLPNPCYWRRRKTNKLINPNYETCEYHLERHERYIYFMEINILLPLPGAGSSLDRILTWGFYDQTTINTAPRIN